MKTINPIYRDELKDVFRYNAETNVLERKWKKGGVWRAVNISVANHNKGYVLVGFDDRIILVHRVIYTLVHGNIPEDMTIDHIDNVKNNNHINNLQLLSHRDNKAKSCGGMKPYFNKHSQSYQVQEQVKFGEKSHAFHFEYFKILSDAQAFCKAYRAQFGFGMPLYKARDSTPEYWLECMQIFKDMYFNNREEYA